jgi:hypothetical protein
MAKTLQSHAPLMLQVMPRDMLWFRMWQNRKQLAIESASQPFQATNLGCKDSEQSWTSIFKQRDYDGCVFEDSTSRNPLNNSMINVRTVLNWFDFLRD